MNALVSIIMPVYNCEEFVSQAIKSILNQSYNNFELLIADDASSDSSRNIISGFGDERIKRFDNSSNIGYLKTCNKLFEHCTGEYITFQDADDWSAVDRIKKLVSEFERDRDLMICGSAIYQFRDNELFPKEYPTSDKEIKGSLLKQNPFCGAAIMIRNSAYKNYGGYHPIFNRIGSEDYFWAGQIALENKALNLSDNLYIYRLNLDSVSKDITSPSNYISTKLAQYALKKFNEKLPINTTDLEDEKNNLLHPFRLDSSLLHRKNCDLNAYFGNKKALKINARKALLAAPSKLINWKYFINSIIR